MKNGKALGAALLFGAGTPLAKLMLDAVSLWLLAGILYLGSGIGLAPIPITLTHTTRTPIDHRGPVARGSRRGAPARLTTICR